MLHAVLDSIPHRIAGWATFAGGVVAAAAADNPAVGWVGFTTAVVGGLVSVYKIWSDANHRRAHEGNCEEKLAASERKQAETDQRLSRAEESIHLLIRGQNPACAQARPEPPSELQALGDLLREREAGRVPFPRDVIDPDIRP